MNSALRTLSIALVASAMCVVANYSEAATITAASCNLSDVQAAVNAAADGDKVVIPNGSCAWASGIRTTKQIRIEAQNYTPSFRGSASRNVTITNNATVPLFWLTSGNVAHAGVSGIRFNEGTGTNNHIRVEGTGSKVPLVNDVTMEVKQRNGNQPDVGAMVILSQGAVLWNMMVVPKQGGSYADGVGPDGACIYMKSPRPWNSASTMGALDVNGAVNVYIEDSTISNVQQCPDADDNARFVIRYSLLDGTMGLTHGFTSTWGGRHFEYYNNTFSNSNPNRNNGRYFWIRAGTGIWTDNVVNDAGNPSMFGHANLADIGDNTNPSGYPQPRAPGRGWNNGDVSDPIYIWNQSGARAYTWGTQDAWVNVVQLNRDIFVNSGPKPGYSKYTYPHPLRGGAVSAGSGSAGNTLQAPSNLRLVQ